VAHYLILTHLLESFKANPIGFLGSVARAPARLQQRPQSAGGELAAGAQRLGARCGVVQR
jgi:hypothetical protein